MFCLMVWDSLLCLYLWMVIARNGIVPGSVVHCAWDVVVTIFFSLCANEFYDRARVFEWYLVVVVIVGIFFFICCKFYFSLCVSLFLFLFLFLLHKFITSARTWLKLTLAHLSLLAFIYVQINRVHLKWMITWKLK